MGFEHILVPTDGSKRSRKATTVALGLAAPLGARITALYVLDEGVPTIFTGKRLYASGVVGAQYRKRAKREAEAALAEIERSAKLAEVPFRGLSRVARAPWQAILKTARARGCDLIVMGSHGRGGVESAVLGSQTLKLLSNSRIPVVVCR